MRAHGLRLLLTAHTRDDQAETLIMRLARGSGLDGLSAMAPIAPLGDCGAGATQACGELQIARPLLDVPKARLRATLSARGIAWIEDPANSAPEFERSRLRAARAGLNALGLTDARLARSAARLLRARRALERVVERLCDPDAGAVEVDACGIIAIDRTRLRQAGEEIALRVLQAAIGAAGGCAEPVPLSGLEAIAAPLCGSGVSGGWTLARALITADEASVTVEREPGRRPLPELTVLPGTSVLWDGRFRASVAPDFSGGPVQVRALGKAALRDLRRHGAVAAGLPPRAAAMVPSVWQAGELIAVPPLRHWRAPRLREAIEATFIGMEKLRQGSR
jgi:tRNA(Ile)-lysidine synthase